MAELSPPESARCYWASGGRWRGLAPEERRGFLEWESALEGSTHAAP